MDSIDNEMPWNSAPDAMACNFALGHLVGELARRLTADGRIHAESYISAVGAIAGYAAQRTLFAESPPVVGVNINRATVASGEHYWFGDSLNYMLVPRTMAEGNRCVWSLAASAAVIAGLPHQQVPKLDLMFKRITATIGGADEGKSSVPARHQAHLPMKDLLKVVWPMAMICFSGKLPGVSREFGAAPIAWWSAIAAQASSRPILNVKDVLPPDIALTLLMESAIYCSKLDQSEIERT
ncbi:hypothetical protein ABIB82_004014 [Bradyrhizobium sp. i1.8.4]|uniref:hypothetical protein n=1 Tax=unclassified Bradyrhizobium TaxID=2631580 RepID=UPI003D1BD029